MAKAPNYARNSCWKQSSNLSARCCEAPLHGISIITVFSVLISLLAATAGIFPSYAEESDPAPGNVFIIPIQDTIDLGLAHFVKRSIREAERKGAAGIVLDMKTLGGRVDAALDIRDALEESEIPVTSFVDKRAISAGALICLSTKEIAMAPGSSIGAATPISISPTGEGQDVGEKQVSYLRSEFRATAERNGHSPLLAEAMVDEDMVVIAVYDDETPRLVSQAEADELRTKDEDLRTEIISAEGKLLTMTASEAKKVGLAASIPASLDEYLQSLGFDPANKTVTRVSWSEIIVRFLTHPIISGLLLTLGILGIFFELQMPGWGISGSVGASLLLLFFGGHYLAGLASVTDILLFAIGLGLIGVEIFAIPGFGVAGVTGFFCVLAGVLLAMVKRPIPRFYWEYQMLNSALLTLLCVFVLVAIGIAILWKTLPHSRFKGIMVLSASEQATDGYTSSESLEELVGRFGKSLSRLRPSGRALIEDIPIEVQTEGEFIEKDRVLKVVRVAGNKVFVVEEQEDESKG